MNDVVLAALIGGACSIVVGIISFCAVASTNNKANANVQKQIEVAQAVNNTKVEELTREVREHNNFARRMPVVEEKIDDALRRIGDLEGYHRERRN